MIQLTLDKVKGLLEQAIAERGEGFVYETPYDDRGTCFYVHNWDRYGDPTEPTPGCIVGYALHQAGVALDVMLQSNDDRAFRLLGHLAASELVTCTPDAERLLIYTQDKQDMGKPWGRAYREALGLIEDSTE